MSYREKDRKRVAAEQFARFQRRPDVQLIATKYADYVHTDHGIQTNLMLGAIALFRVADQMTEEQYEQEIEKLANLRGLPLADVRIMAECQVEALKSGLMATGQRPNMTGFHPRYQTKG